MTSINAVALQEEYVGEELANMFINSFASKNTQATYENAIKHFFQVENISDISLFVLRSIRNADVLNYVHKLLNEGFSSSSIRNRISALRSFYNFLMSNNPYIKTNPFKNGYVTRLLSVKLEKDDNLPKTEMLTLEQLQKIYSVIDTSTKIGKRDYLLVKLMANTGMRREEVCNIRLCDIEKKEDTEKEEDLWFINVIGKGRKHRIIQIDKNIVKLIENYTGKQMPCKDKNYLFTSLSNRKSINGKINPQTVWDIIAKHCKKAGIVNISPHSFRHFWVTQLIMAGNKLPDVQYLAGHSNSNTTMRYFHKFDIYHSGIKTNF